MKSAVRESKRGFRVARFQSEIDALPNRGYGGVLSLGPAPMRFTIEHRGSIGWETKQGGGHVGLFASAGEAVNAAWELSPWSLAPDKG